MKKLIRYEDEFDILCMSKISEKYADTSKTGTVPNFYYYSECNGNHSPRIKFYGGTSKSKSTRDCPYVSFGIDEDPKLMDTKNLNRKDYPNAFNNEIVESCKGFIINNRPLLLLVWFRRLDEADLLEYFNGRLSFEDIIECIDFDLSSYTINDMDTLHKICKDNELYNFPQT